LLAQARPLFRAPSFALFADLLTGWVLTPGRRTITAMIAVLDPAAGRAHDAYHRFLRDGARSMNGPWRLLTVHAVATFAPTGVLALDCDDYVEGGIMRIGPPVGRWFACWRGLAGRQHSA
jgi:hypothetical protein